MQNNRSTVREWLAAAGLFCAWLTGAAQAAQPGKVTTIFTFGPYEPPAYREPATGRLPYAGLLSLSNGNAFVGATNEGGVLPAGQPVGGTLYKITRDPGHATATFTRLHTFDLNSEGAVPENTPVTDGVSLFGNLVYNGSGGQGSIYQWTPNGEDSVLQVLHGFTGGTDGSEPNGLYRSMDGTLYGTTYSGGGASDGTIFSLSPPAAGQSAWTYSILHVFVGTDGSAPQGPLVADAAGNLYGVTMDGGAANAGTAYRLSPPASAGQPWILTNLMAFSYDFDSSARPNGALVLDSKGVLFGVSLSGGTSGYGTVFELSPPAGGGTQWNETVLHSFDNTDGDYPNGSLLPMPDGSFYGTTYAGGALPQKFGTGFHIVPPADGTGPWTFVSLHAFVCKNGQGTNPASGFSLTPAGTLIGAATFCGNGNSGTIYLMQP